MPRHADMDYPHIPMWCDDCTQQDIQADMLREIRRQNDLKETELRMKYEDDWIERKPLPRPRPTYAPEAQPKPETIGRGGMNIEPRRA